MFNIKNFFTDGRNQRNLVTAAVAMIGILVSIVTFYLSYRWEQKKLSDLFQSIAGQYFHYIKDATENDISVLYSFRDFYNASEDVSRNEFNEFAKGIFLRQPYIYEVGWVPVVSGSDRAALEARAVAEGIKNFTIKEINDNGQFVVAASREKYFPILYIAHSPKDTEGLEEILGIDIATLPDRLLIMKRATDSGKPVLINNQSTYGKIYEKDGFSISSRFFLPIYYRNKPIETVQERRDNIQGFIVLMYRVEDVLRVALQKTPITNIDISIYLNSPKERKLLASYAAPALRAKKAKPMDFDERKCPGCLSWNQVLPVADSEWLIVYQADLKNFSAQKIVLPWILLILGFLITILFLFYFQSILDRSAMVEALVNKKTEELQQASKEWSDTIDAITEFIFILDKDCTIRKVNKPFLAAFHLSEQDVIGKKCHEIVHQTKVPWVTCPHQRTLINKKPASEIVDDPRLNMTLLVTTSPIFDKNAHFYASVHVAKDITDIKKNQDALLQAKKDAEDQAWGLAKANEGIKILYKELEEKNRELVRLGQLKSSFVSMVSHELRTPLTAIKEGVAIVLDGVAGPILDEQKDFLETAKRNVDRLTRLINNILDFQKIDAGKMKFDYQESSINEIAKEVYQTMEPLIRDKQLDFFLELDEAIPMIKMDRDKITQVITNLVGNAMKFTRSGHVGIITKKGDNIIQVTVKDTGIGVPNEDLAKLFHYFEQTGDIAQRRGGTGLGLAICKEIVAMHNGKIWIESEYGKGTSVHFVLPVVERRA